MIKKPVRFIFLFLTAALLTISALTDVKASDDKVWREIDDAPLRQKGAERLVVPDIYKTFRLNKNALQTILDQAPLEFSAEARSAQVILSLPLPDGGFSRFAINESPIMESPLAAKYPEIKTYNGQGIDNPRATTRISLTPAGFSAIILSERGTILIDPYAKDDTVNYIVYDKAFVSDDNNFFCEVGSDHVDIGETKQDFFQFGANLVSNGTTLRTYRLALAATGEYTNVFRQPGDTDAQAKARALAAQVLIMNRVNGVYERDVAVRMIIIANNDLIIYTDPATDPYTNNNGVTMLSQNTTNLNAVIGVENYDVGHVFSTGGGGVATLNGPCGTNKARGVTGLPNPVGDAFAIDYVAHEMGHQFGANHTFNGGTGNCSGGNRSASSAYEPGSGITIMAYAGICGSQDLAKNSIDTFHVKSLEVIVNFITNLGGSTCSTNIATNNTIPTITTVGGSSFNIPKQTPFSLTAAATDPDNDSLTYDWQEYDLGPTTTAVPNNDADGNPRPIFRPYLPTTSGTRYFPSLQYILNNANVPPATYSCGGANCLTGEILPAITRTMTFQAIARDNRANGGGINTVTSTVIVDGGSGPFLVTAPNTNVTWAPGSSQTVAWDVANTTAAPISAANVQILLSTDGGQTFPTVLAASTPNDGTQAVTIPSVSTTTARIKVQAVDNIFFDISNANFTIGSVVAQNNLFDFDGDGKDDISIYRNGTWYLRNSEQGSRVITFGQATDETVAADYDGDGKTDTAVFRNGTWIILNSSDGTVRFVSWGQAGDIPLVGDYDGDDEADLTVFRGGVWYIYQSDTGTLRAETFGLATDKPVVGDFDGDGEQDLAVFRSGTWYVNGSQAGVSITTFGQAGDVAVPADYDGDGKTDFAVFRGGVWYVLGSQAGFSAVTFGASGDVPVPADYDGDGEADIAIFRNGLWYSLRSQTGVNLTSFGQAGDKPIPAQSF